MSDARRALTTAQLAARHQRQFVDIVSAISATLGLGLTALIYLPVVLLALLSFSLDPFSGVPKGFTLEWYAELFADPRWLDPLWLSLGIALATAVLCMVAATLVGRLLPRLRRARLGLLLLFLLPLIVPGIVLGIQEFAFWRIFLGIRPGIWLLVLTHFLWAFPFSLLGMLVVTFRFDVRLLEAAADLGASQWRRFVDIELPLIVPGIVTAGMFGFLLSLTELARSLFVRGGEVPLPVYLWAEASARTSHAPLIYGLNTLIALASTLISVLAVVILGRMARSRHA
jgi:ABC-type spermidine/putrescine transport system permease subunit II